VLLGAVERRALAAVALLGVVPNVLVAEVELVLVAAAVEVVGAVRAVEQEVLGAVVRVLVVEAFVRAAVGRALAAAERLCAVPKHFAQAGLGVVPVVVELAAVDAADRDRAVEVLLVLVLVPVPTLGAVAVALRPDLAAAVPTHASLI